MVPLEPRLFGRSKCNQGCPKMDGRSIFRVPPAIVAEATLPAKGGLCCKGPLESAPPRVDHSTCTGRQGLADEMEANPMPKWSERPKEDRWAIIGAMIGMAIAGVIAVVFASESSTMVRYLIMAVGLIVGLGAGKLSASRP